MNRSPTLEYHAYTRPKRSTMIDHQLTISGISNSAYDSSQTKQERYAYYRAWLLINQIRSFFINSNRELSKLNTGSFSVKTHSEIPLGLQKSFEMTHARKGSTRNGPMKSEHKEDKMPIPSMGKWGPRIGLAGHQTRKFKKPTGFH